MEIMEQVKALLGIEDDLQDNLLSVIQDLTVANFRAYTGAETVPSDLEYIVVEVAVKRFNRVGAEGMTSHGLEGLSMSFELDDFKEYDSILKRAFSKTFNAGFKML